MATLKGQNFRILKKVTVEGVDKWRVIAKASNCNLTVSNNTGEGSTKDILGAASNPILTSRTWSASVESLDVLDMASILETIQSMEPLDIMFSEVSTSDNQTPVTDLEKLIIPWIGKAYISDATFTFNDRENATKQIQFTGTSQLDILPTPSVDLITPDQDYTKGQLVRLFIVGVDEDAPNTVIAAAKQLSFHVSVSMEDATTKDTYGNFQRMEPSGFSYEITSNALVRSGETITSQVDGVTVHSLIFASQIAESPVTWKIANVNGNISAGNNRTATSTLVSGSALLTQVNVNAPNRQNADYSVTLTGVGPYVLGDN